MSIKSDTLQGRSASDVAQFCAFLDDDASRSVVEQVVRDLVIAHATVAKGDIRAATKALGQRRSPKTLIVDLSKAELPLSDINELAEVCEPGVTVIAVGERNDVGLFRELLNSGVSDYLIKPLTPALVQRALLATADAETRSRQTTRLGRLVTIVGARGGVGATMLATSIAWTVANRRRRRVALLDLDLQFGSVALSLDLEPTHGLRETLESAGRVDSLYIERSMIQHSESLFVLSSEEELAEPTPCDPQALLGLLGELRSKFHYLVVDMPKSAFHDCQSALKESTHCIVVTDMSLAGMRDTLRISQTISNLNAGAQLCIVANRTGEFRNGEISRQEFEKAIGRQIDICVPFQPRNVNSAMNMGSPVASCNDAIQTAIEKVIDLVSGTAPTAKPKTLRRLLGL
jgi:pilus assembly protein CpaE